MLNHIVLQGNACADPELRYTSSQVPVCTVTIGVSRDFAKDGQQTTDFIDIVTYRKTAEFLSRYFTKGSAVIVTGRLQIRLYKDKDGNPRRATEVVADNVYFGESRRSAETPADPTAGYNPPPRAASRPVNVTPPFEDLGDDQGELPF